MVGFSGSKEGRQHFGSSATGIRDDALIVRAGEEKGNRVEGSKTLNLFL